MSVDQVDRKPLVVAKPYRWMWPPGGLGGGRNSGAENHLGQYLTAVSLGDELIVTDRARAVAKITLIGTTRTIDQLMPSGSARRHGAAELERLYEQMDKVEISDRQQQ
jgi:antitoxin (DNA-binding transcriptional repressor) of toxin-antitoxin stability system